MIFISNFSFLIICLISDFNTRIMRLDCQLFILPTNIHDISILIECWRIDYLYNRVKLFEREGNKQLKLFNTTYQYYRLNINTSKRCMSVLPYLQSIIIFLVSITKYFSTIVLLCVTNKSMVQQRIFAICKIFITSPRFSDYAFSGRRQRGCKEEILAICVH